MSQSMDIHSEAFQELLAEALRCGPGSPAWRQATELLRDAGGQGEEYAMLCRAREDLESGKQYRSIRAGNGFTQKLMERIDEEEGKKRWSPPTASAVAVAAIIAVVVAIAVIAYLAISPASHNKTLAELRETLCVTPVADAQLDKAIPDNFAHLGKLPLAASGGLRVDGQQPKTDQFVGGGIRYAQPLPADGVYAIEMVVEANDTKTPLITQLFVTDSGEASADKGIAKQELVCLIENGKLRVLLPGGQTAAEVPLALDYSVLTSIRLKLSNDLAIVEQNGSTVWSGTYHLDRPQRYVGVRYLSKGGEQAAGVVVKSLRIMKP